ncbi:hypothetical protein BASA61_006481 [Batrachochytrium salamandrivorans]|nr:hypothetical protein BASA62_007549 [Batrachochytrium salamandrivorans]KAH6586685.1 hypothetical protein BASA61_006481 [Batrachochytrium salamandrivorans]
MMVATTTKQHSDTSPAPVAGLQRPLARFFTSCKYADAVLRVRNLTETAHVIDVPVHRVILASQSDFFDKLFAQAPEDRASIQGDDGLGLRTAVTVAKVRRLVNCSCWYVLALARRMGVPDLEAHVGKWIVDYVLTRTPNVQRPTAEWYNCILGALHAQVSQAVVETLIEAAVCDDHYLSPQPTASTRSFRRYVVLRDLVREAENVGEPLSNKQVRYMFRTVKFEQWPRDQLQQAYMDGLLPRDKVSAALSGSESQPSQPLSESNIVERKAEEPTYMISSALKNTIPHIVSNNALAIRRSDASAQTYEEDNMRTVKQKIIKNSRKSILDFQSTAKSTSPIRATVLLKPSSTTNSNSYEGAISKMGSVEFSCPSTCTNLSSIASFESPAVKPLSDMDSCQKMSLLKDTNEEIPVKLSSPTGSIISINERTHQKSIVAPILDISSITLPTSVENKAGNNVDDDGQQTKSHSEKTCETPEQCLKDIRQQLEHLFDNEPSFFSNVQSVVSAPVVADAYPTTDNHVLNKGSVVRCPGNFPENAMSGTNIPISTSIDHELNIISSNKSGRKLIRPLFESTAEVKALHDPVQSKLGLAKDTYQGATGHAVNTAGFQETQMQRDKLQYGPNQQRDRSKTAPSTYQYGRFTMPNIMETNHIPITMTSSSSTTSMGGYKFEKNDMSLQEFLSEKKLRDDPSNNHSHTWNPNSRFLDTLKQQQSKLDEIHGGDDPNTPTPTLLNANNKYDVPSVLYMASRPSASSYPLPIPPSQVKSKSFLNQGRDLGSTTRKIRPTLPVPPDANGQREARSQQSSTLKNSLSASSMHEKFNQASLYNSAVLDGPPNYNVGRHISTTSIDGQDQPPRRSLFISRKKKPEHNRGSYSILPPNDKRFSLPSLEASSSFINDSVDDIFFDEPNSKHDTRSGVSYMTRPKHDSIISVVKPMHPHNAAGSTFIGGARSFNAGSSMSDCSVDSEELGRLELSPTLILDQQKLLQMQKQRQQQIKSGKASRLEVKKKPSFFELLKGLI